MIRTVQCTSCSTSFPVDPKKVPAEGVYARCSACQGVFFVEGGMAMAASAPAASSFAAPTAPSFEPATPSFQPAAPSFDSAPAFERAPSFDPPAPPMRESTPVFEGVPHPAFATPVEPPPPPPLSPTLAEPDSWVFETEPEIDPSTLNVQRLDTVEERMRIAKDDTPSFSKPGGLGAPPKPTPPAPAEPAPEPIRAAPPPPPAPAAAPAAAKPAGFTFGKRDPHEKASRLARVLVSDIITYNPERHQRALDAGTIKQDFEDEVKKSWGEYVDQVGRDLAESTEYFNQALNEILARGQKLY